MRDKESLLLAYHVEGRVSLLSDGIAHKVSIAAPRYVHVPRMTGAAFIKDGSRTRASTTSCSLVLQVSLWAIAS